MKPKPLESLNHFTLPVAMCHSVSCSAARATETEVRFRARWSRELDCHYRRRMRRREGTGYSLLEIRRGDSTTGLVGINAYSKETSIAARFSTYGDGPPRGLRTRFDAARYGGLDGLQAGL